MNIMYLDQSLLVVLFLGEVDGDWMVYIVCQIAIESYDLYPLQMIAVMEESGCDIVVAIVSLDNLCGRY